MITPGQIYRHYKSIGGSHHTYQIIGIARHSETHEEMVVYQPLFEAENTWLGDAQFAVRPISMWFDMVEYEGKIIQRFILVE